MEQLKKRKEKFIERILSYSKPDGEVVKLLEQKEGFIAFKIGNSIDKYYFNEELFKVLQPHFEPNKLFLPYEIEFEFLYEEDEKNEDEYKTIRVEFEVDNENFVFIIGEIFEDEYGRKVVNHLDFHVSRILEDETVTAYFDKYPISNSQKVKLLELAEIISSYIENTPNYKYNSISKKIEKQLAI